MKKYINYLAGILLSIGFVCGLEIAGAAKLPECGEGMVYDGLYKQCVVENPEHDGGMNDSGINEGGEQPGEGGDTESDGATPCTFVPTLQNFTITDNTCTDQTIAFGLTPTGNPGFYLHVALSFEAGQDVLSTWCTGNEALCKAIGNGQNCSGSEYTGWCYKGN